MTNRIVLDIHAFKALAAPTRLEILKLLEERPHTASEIADQLHFAVPTIKEHLDSLEGAQLVHRTDDGHKWKYYKLTSKGSAVLTPHDTNFTVLLATTVFAAIGATYSLYRYFHDRTSSFVQEQAASKWATDTSLTMAAAPAEITPLPDYSYLLIALAFIAIVVGSMYLVWRGKNHCDLS